MDHSLRCNILNCRIELRDRAVVTTCSHVFCERCAQSEGLMNPPPGGDRRCPACRTALTNPDDCVSTLLNPTEDYKQSVLSGLDPHTITECAARALHFWNYQQTQEIFLQEHMYKNMRDKYANLDNQMNKVVEDANSQIGILHNKLESLRLENENVLQKNKDLVEKFKEKTKQHSFQKQLYDKLKAQTLQAGLQMAAAESAEATAQSISDRNHATATTENLHFQPPGSVSRVNTQYLQAFGNSNPGDPQGFRRRAGSGSLDSNQGMNPPPRPGPNQRFPTIQSGTPRHRERLGMPSSHHPAQRSSIPQPSQGFTGGNMEPPPSVHRVPIGSSTSRLNLMSAGSYGMSAGAKIGRSAGSDAGYAGVGKGLRGSQHNGGQYDDHFSLGFR